MLVAASICPPLVAIVTVEPLIVRPPAAGITVWPAAPAKVTVSPVPLTTVPPVCAFNPARVMAAEPKLFNSRRVEPPKPLSTTRALRVRVFWLLVTNNSCKPVPAPPAAIRPLSAVAPMELLLAVLLSRPPLTRFKMSEPSVNVMLALAGMLREFSVKVSALPV